MSEFESPDLRIGDAERDEALQALGEHLKMGRLDVEEYGERAARVAAAKTHRDLTQLFVDLPEPRPKFAQASTPEPRFSKPGAAVTAREAGGVTAGQRFANAIVPLSVIVAAALFFSRMGLWVIFLLPVAVAIIAGSLMGGNRRRR